MIYRLPQKQIMQGLECLLLQNDVIQVYFIGLIDYAIGLCAANK